MLQQFAKLPVRKRVGIIAIFLGFIAIFAGSPYDRNTTRINVKEMSSISIKDDNSTTVEELADWIIKGKYDYRLVDLRDTEKYTNYNIPGSENIPLKELFDYDLMRNEKIVLYSDDNISASQAWFILKSDDFKSVNIVDGGLTSWKNKVLFPKIPADISPEQQLEYEKMIEVSKFFGGKPMVVGESNQEIMQETPKLKAPPKVKVNTKRKKKSREGC